MRPCWRLGILTLLALLIPAAVGAGEIHIQALVTPQVLEDHLSVEVRLQNLGNDTAYDLHVEAEVDHRAKAVPAADELPPGRIARAAFNLTPTHDLPGTYGVIVRISFRDAGGRSLGALAVGLYDYKEPARSRVTAQPRTVMVAERGRLTVDLANHDDQDRKVRLRLFSPNGIRVKPAETLVDTPASGTASASFDLENRGAPNGADYPLLLFVDYEEDGRRHFALVRNRAEVMSREGVFVRYWIPLLLVALALLATGAAIEVSGRKRPEDRQT